MKLFKKITVINEPLNKYGSNKIKKIFINCAGYVYKILYLF